MKRIVVVVVLVLAGCYGPPEGDVWEGIPAGAERVIYQDPSHDWPTRIWRLNGCVYTEEFEYGTDWDLTDVECGT